jgi:uncharacterized protein (DUF952 family)
MPIFHLLTPQDWASARSAGAVIPPSLATEGFVHCSTRDQVEGTIARHLQGIDELVLLELDDASLGDGLRWEESRPGERYPHLYRPISVDEVVGTEVWRRP